VAEVRGGQEFRGWDRDRYQLVALTDAVRILTYVFILANSDPKKAPPKVPEPSPTPDELTTKKQAQPGSFAFIAKAKIAEARKRKAQAE
jgi:hypothetical protein